MSSILKAGKSALFILTAALVLSLGTGKPAKAQSEPLLGQLMLFGGNFCPRNWAAANGALLPISQNTALFSLFGTIYGGDGRTTFALPDLRGRAPVHYGQGPGLSDHRQGAPYGHETTVLSVAEMPSHSHMVNAVGQRGDKGGPGDDYLAIPYPLRDPTDWKAVSIYHNGPPDKQMDPGMIADSGGSQAFSITAPRLPMMWCVALSGLYPSRS